MHHVPIPGRRYQQQHRRTRTTRPGREPLDRRETIKGTHTMGEITVQNYVVNPDAVADAIVRRLLAGSRKS